MTYLKKYDLIFIKTKSVFRFSRKKHCYFDLFHVTVAMISTVVSADFHRNRQLLNTPQGKERKKYLQIVYLNESQKMYDHAKQELVKFVHDIKEKGFTKIVLYGAGEVAEIFLHTIKDEVEVLAVIDDDPQKQGLHLAHVKIISLQELKDYPYDAVLISSFGHYKTMLANLNKANVSNHQIVHFF